MVNYTGHEVKSNVKKYFTIAFKVFFGIIAAIAFALLIGYGVMLLWNWLIPDIFGATAITYWQSVGILVLAKLLFGGFGCHNPKRGRDNSRTHWRRKTQQNCKNNFQSWKYYDTFWEKEGKNAYKEYVARIEDKKP